MGCAVRVEDPRAYVEQASVQNWCVPQAKCAPHLQNLLGSFDSGVVRWVVACRCVRAVCVVCSPFCPRVASHVVDEVERAAADGSGTPLSRQPTRGRVTVLVVSCNNQIFFYVKSIPPYPLYLTFGSHPPTAPPPTTHPRHPPLSCNDLT